jgi:adenylate kinase family enzyme
MSDRVCQGGIMSKKIFIFSGLPGSGKSTQVKTLAELLPMSQVFHLGFWAKMKGLRDNGARKRGELLPFEHAVMFLQEALAFCGHIIFDGFPRAVAEVDLLLGQVREIGGEVILLSFEFPGTLGQGLEQSRARQVHRNELAGRDLDFTRIEGKLKRVSESDLPALEKLKGSVEENIQFLALKMIEKVLS